MIYHNVSTLFTRDEKIEWLISITFLWLINNFACNEADQSDIFTKNITMASPPLIWSELGLAATVWGNPCHCMDWFGPRNRHIHTQSLRKLTVKLAVDVVNFCGE